MCFVWNTSCIFWWLEVLPVHLWREIKPFIIWFYPPLLWYDVSMDEAVELVMVIPMSPDHRNRVRMEKLLPFLYCYFFPSGLSGADYFNNPALKILLRTFGRGSSKGGGWIFRPRGSDFPGEKMTVTVRFRGRNLIGPPSSPKAS
jgi:hypothetical protein